MKIYKINESVNECGRHVCGGSGCRTIKYTMNEVKANEFVNKELCPIVCRCKEVIEVEED